jgi:hypothetical protein
MVDQYFWYHLILTFLVGEDDATGFLVGVRVGFLVGLSVGFEVK